MKQVMNLLNLAPDIQEQLLFGVASLPAEHCLRGLATQVQWTRQRLLWRDMVKNPPSPRAGSG